MSRFICVLKSWVLHVLLLACAGFPSTADASQHEVFKLPKSFIESRPLVLDPAQRQWLNDRGRLRVGIFMGDYAPMDIATDNNLYQGISADYLSLVCEKLGISAYVLGFSKREQAVAALLSGEVDMLTSANGYERGIEGLAFSTNYMQDRSVIVGRDSDTVPTTHWDGKKIGFLEGDVDILVADAFYPKSEIVLMPNLGSAMEALSEGEIDGLIGNEVIMRAFKTYRPYSGLRFVGDSALPMSDFAFVARRNDKPLIALIDQALNSLDSSVAQVILSRWTTGGGVGQQHLKLLPHELEWIKRNPVVTVATQQYPLYAFKNGDVRWEGLSVDILNRISRMTGLKFVHRESLSTSQTLDMLKHGKAQMNTTLTKSEERKAYLNFTHSFGGAPWVFVVRINNSRLGSLSQLSGKVLALPAKHALESMIVREYPEIKLKRVDNYAQARHLVELGDADATIQNETQAYLYPPGRLRVGRSVDGRWSTDNFSVSVNYPELLDILNKGLEALPMADVQALRIKWLRAGRQPVIHSGRSHAWWMYWLMAAFVAAGVILVMWNRRLARLSRLRQLTDHKTQEYLAFQKRFFDAIPYPVFVSGLEGQIITCNRTYEECFSTRAELMSGKRVTEVGAFSAEDAEQLNSQLMQVLNSRKPSYQKQPEVGSKVNVQTYRWVVPFYSGAGHLEGVVGGFFDVSETKKWG